MHAFVVLCSVCSSAVLTAGVDRRAQTDSVTESVVELLHNEQGRPQPLCDLQISAEGIKMFHVEGSANPVSMLHAGDAVMMYGEHGGLDGGKGCNGGLDGGQGCVRCDPHAASARP
jgi:hypothetical protein